MRFFRRCLTALAAVAFLSPAMAEEEAPAHPLRPMLWKVEGGKLEKPSWLFGTIHVGKGPVAELHPAAARAFDEADAVYTELEMDPATQLGLAKHFLREDGRRLSDSIGEELSAQLEKELKLIQPALTSAVLQTFKTWAVAITLPTLKLQLDGAPPLDMILWQNAAKAGKATSALEKPQDQFVIFDDLSEEEQVIMLSETIRQLKEARVSGEDLTQKLIDSYVAGDDEEVMGWMNRSYEEMLEGEHPELGKKLLKRLINDRNAAMAAVILSKLKSEPGKGHFFAVGTAHYLGEESIGNHLSKQGYKVTRVNE